MPGEKVRWPDWKPGRVAIVTEMPDPNMFYVPPNLQGNEDLCWIAEPDSQIVRARTPQPFIWRFPEGLNNQAEIVE